MLKEIIKRDGTTEPFIPAKVNSWSIWASEQLGERVDWSGVVMEAMSHFKDKASSQDLQKQLIKICVQKRSWPYSLMAGRLYAALSCKEIYGSTKPPTIKEVHNNCFVAGLMRKLDYSDYEYAQIEKFIDHNRDFELAYPQLLQLRKKYAIRNRTNGQEFESAQFVYMRMAMALAEDEPKEERLHHVVNWYNHFSFNRLNAPSPNYINLGTKLNGYSSCCVLKSNDDVNSLAIGDHIAYKMTAMSAGIGGTIETRSINDPVRGGAIKHGGKLSYYRSLAYATKANQQAGRGGAATMYYSAFDPENTTIAMLQNPMSTEDAKIREIHFGVMFNRLFTKKAAKNEDVFLFTEYSAPDLWKLMFSGDQDGFEKLYKEYEDNEYFEKKYINARDFVILARQQAYECGTHYELFIDEMNRHTPFKDPIHSSNLCVAGDTKILTDKGYIEIRSVVDTEVNVWNGQEWSAVIVR
nr:ribonucleotide reductase N-terminal alpha domain-containing protein [Acinetobacter johnsonii]